MLYYLEKYQDFYVKGVIVQKIEPFRDHRGWLAEFYREDETPYRPVMSYISMTRPGVTRGPHEHAEQTDYFCLVGRFRIYLWDNRPESATRGMRQVIDTEGDPHVVIVPPRVVHAYRNIGSNDGLVINLPDRLFRGKDKEEAVDEIRHETDPNSPFRVEE